MYDVHMYVYIHIYYIYTFMHTNIFESPKIYNKYPVNQNSLLVLRYLKYQKARKIAFPVKIS